MMIESLNIKALDILKDYPIKDRPVIINIRSGSKEADKFDDTTLLVYNNNVLVRVASTCDAGIPNLEHPVNKDGTAIVMNGLYPDLWKIGLHRGKYEALVQNAPIVVFRDDNGDSVLDYPDIVVNSEFIDIIETERNDMTFTDNDINYRVQRGMFGINLHRASRWKTLDQVGLYSAGCCVIQKYDDYMLFMDAVKDVLETSKQTSIDALYVTERLINNYNK